MRKFNLISLLTVITIATQMLYAFDVIPGDSIIIGEIICPDVDSLFFTSCEPQEVGFVLMDTVCHHIDTTRIYFTIIDWTDEETLHISPSSPLIDISGSIDSITVVVSLPDSMFGDGDTISVTLDSAFAICFICGIDSVTFTYRCATVTYGTVEHNGKCWLDRNLGASRVATAYNDAEAYGDLFQWGRCDDGHQDRSSANYAGPVVSSSCSGGNAWDGEFITNSSSPYDWIDPQDNTLWQGVSGTNNPCPPGWRIPTEAEWETERASWDTYDYNGAFGSPLKLVAGGYRYYEYGGVYYEGVIGFYWSSTVDGSNSVILIFSSGYANVDASRARGHGMSVRCIKD